MRRIHRKAAFELNGSRTQKNVGGNTDYYSYDCENRLVSLVYNTGPGGTAGTYSYAYDYRTRRVGRTEPGAGTTRIVFNGGTSIQEYGVGGGPVVEYVRGAGMGGGVGGLEYSVRSAGTRFNHYNNRGDVVGQTDASAEPAFEAQYQAFGTPSAQSGSTQDRQRANTKEQDPTQLLNEGFRYRDPDTGTFITRDPIGFLAGPNMYTYVMQNPWSKFDPLGLEDWKPLTTKDFVDDAKARTKDIWKVFDIRRVGDVFEDTIRRALEMPENRHMYFILGHGAVPDMIGNTSYTIRDDRGFPMLKYTFDESVFIDVKFKSAFQLYDKWRPFQIPTYINWLRYAEGGTIEKALVDKVPAPYIRASEYGLASVVFITPANTLIAPDIGTFGDRNHVAVYQATVEFNAADDKLRVNPTKLINKVWVTDKKDLGLLDKQSAGEIINWNYKRGDAQNQ